MISSPLRCSEFVGRRKEYEFLTSRFREAVNSRGSFSVVVGDAGIGKSRLVTELCKSAEKQGAQVVTGRCPDSIQAPYTPFREIFEALRSWDTSALLSGHKLPVSNAPSQVPDVLATLERSSGDSFAKVREFAAIARYLKKKAECHPLLIVIEDAQWADAATLELLESLQHGLEGTKVVVVITARPEVLRHNHLAWEPLTRLARAGASTVQLGSMPAGEIRQLAESALAGHRLSVGRMTRILELAEGNPLFVEELLRNELQSSKEQDAETELATLSVRGLFLRRLKQLDSNQQRVIAHATAIGRTFDARLLARVLGVPLQQIMPALRKARDTQLVTENRTSAGRFAFRHALMREVFYRELLAAEAQELHTKIAMALEESTASAADLSELAYQWSAAGEPAKAAHYNELAGDAAFDVFAYGDAARFYRRAFDFESSAGERRARLCEKLAYSLYVGGYTDDTREWFDRALNEYGCLGSTEKMAQMLIYIARQCWNDADTQAGLPMAARALELSAPKSRLRAYAQVMMGSYCAVLGKPEEAMSYLKDTRSLSSSQKPEIAGRFYDSRAQAWAHQGKIAAALADFHRAVKIAQRSKEPDLIVRVCSNFANYAVWLGDGDLATACWAQALAAAQGGQLAGRTAYTALGYAWTQMWLGKLEHARELLDQALVSGVDNACVRILKAAVGIPLGLMLQDASLTRRCADENTIDLAFRSTEAQRIGPVASAFVDLWISQGRVEDAQGLIRRAIMAMNSPDQSWWLFTQAATHSEHICYSRARTVLLDASTNPGHVVAAAHLKLFDALISQREDRPKDACALARQAQDLFAKISWPRCQAMALEITGDYGAALGLYRQIGNRRDEERLDALLAPRHRRGRSGTSLTPRERDVVAQVTAGHSNREIAAVLSISERTVEHHLESIFNRLGIRSRAQLIALGLGGAELDNRSANASRHPRWVESPMHKPSA